MVQEIVSSFVHLIKIWYLEPSLIHAKIAKQVVPLVIKVLDLFSTILTV